MRSDYCLRPRNPIIANACFFAGYIDTWGRGTLKIINACKEAGLPEPDIKEMNGGVEVTIFLQTIDNETSGPIGGPIDNLTDRQKEVLQIIEEHNKISKRKLAEQLNINVSAAQAHLDILKEKGLIRREGGTRGFWKILYKK
ncbi:MAG: ATP-binding protein [Bacteroidota bacterium]|nr:ATP-binding protein [Bacteroidota bacterium]